MKAFFGALAPARGTGPVSWMRLIFFLTSLLLTASTLVAQDGKKRLVFPSTAPATAPTPSGKSAQNIEPPVLLQHFFEALKADQLDAAYEGLAKNTIIAERAENLQQLKEKTRDAMDNFGPVTGYEVVETVELGKHLIRLTCLSLNEDLPLRWRFYFYRTAERWKIVDLRVDDGIVELFEEAARNRKK
jgi:hypothetical protein